MKSNELSLNRLTEVQSVPRPHFGDASIVFDSDGVFKYIDGNDGAMKLIYPPANILFLYPEAKLAIDGSVISTSLFNNFGSIADFKIFGQYLERYSGNGITSITTFKNVGFLTEVRNVGTASAISIGNMNLSAATINQFFTDLPATTRTATISVTSNPGSASCTPSIATEKGYIVNQ
jgi:hypothetical protein